MTERVRTNETGIQNREFKTYQVCELWLLHSHAYLNIAYTGEGVKDPIIWSVTLISFTNAVRPYHFDLVIAHLSVRA